MRVPFRFPIALAIFGFAIGTAGTAFGQSGEGTRGNTPPGQSQDGSRPGDGAIVGGSIRSGERAGTPESMPSTRGVDRCNELSGTLREQCLEQERRSASGGTGVPDASSREARPVTDTTPPQNPRR